MDFISCADKDGFRKSSHIYEVGTGAIQLSMKWGFQSSTDFFKTAKANYRIIVINYIVAYIIAVFDCS